MQEHRHLLSRVLICCCFRAQHRFMEIRAESFLQPLSEVAPIRPQIKFAPKNFKTKNFPARRALEFSFFPYQHRRCCCFECVGVYLVIPRFFVRRLFHPPHKTFPKRFSRPCFTKFYVAAGSELVCVRCLLRVSCFSFPRHQHTRQKMSVDFLACIFFLRDECCHRSTHKICRHVEGKFGGKERAREGEKYSIV